MVDLVAGEEAGSVFLLPCMLSRLSSKVSHVKISRHLLVLGLGRLVCASLCWSYGHPLRVRSRVQMDYSQWLESGSVPGVP